MDFLHPNTSIDQTVALIRRHVATETPISLTRFGDGEIHIINNTGQVEFRKAFCANWGYNYPDQCDECYERAREILVYAMARSDILGFLDPNSPLLPAGFYDPHRWALPASFLRGIGRDPGNTVICDHMISRTKQLGSIEGLKTLLSGKGVNIISPNACKLEAKQLSKLLDTHVAVTDHPYSLSFTTRGAFIKQLSTIKEPVVLYGTGLLKDYGVYVRDNFGKVALDFGATLDAWAGIISRPWFNVGSRQDYLLV